MSENALDGSVTAVKCWKICEIQQKFNYIAFQSNPNKTIVMKWTKSTCTKFVHVIIHSFCTSCFNVHPHTHTHIILYTPITREKTHLPTLDRNLIKTHDTSH